MNALRIGETLFVQTSRKRGLVASLLFVALLVLSLSVLTGFGLGRELLMVREAGLATLYLASFLCALLAATHSAGRAGLDWTREAESRVGGRAPLALGLLLHPLLAAFWAFLLLVPFFVASLAAFQGRTLPAVGALLAAASVPAVTFLLAKRGLSGGLARLAPALAAALLTVPVLRYTPGGGEVIRALALTPAALLASAVLPGALAVLLPGPAGWAGAASLFLLANMRQAIVDNPVGAWIGLLLPDLASLNPSLAVTRTEALRWGSVAGSLGYAGLFALGVLLVTLGCSTPGSDRGSVTR